MPHHGVVPDGTPGELAADLSVRNVYLCVAVAAITALTYDFLLTIADEQKYIWQRWITHTKIVKIVYVVNRYVPFITLSILLSNPPAWHAMEVNSPSAYGYCKMRYALKLLFSQFQLSTLGTILMVRIYALYKRKQSVKRILAILWTLEIVATAIVMGIVIPRLSFSQVCVPHISVGLFIFFSILGSIAQCVIWGFTFAKCYWPFSPPLLVKSAWMTTLLVDGLLAFGAFISLIVVDAFLYFRVNKAYAMLSPNIIIACLSIAGNRMTINMLRMADKVEGPATSNPAFTSMLDGSQSFVHSVPLQPIVSPSEATTEEV